MNARSPRFQQPDRHLRTLRREAAERMFQDAAEAVIAEYGYERATMQAVAHRAGCAVGTIYIYFKDKLHLYDAIISRHAVAIAKGIDAAHGTEGPALERLLRGIQTLVRYFQANTSFFRIYYTAAPSGRVLHHTSLPSTALAAFNESRRRELALMREAQRMRAVRRDVTPDDLVEFLRGVVLTTFARWATEERPPSLGAQEKLLRRLLLGGILGTEDRAS